MSDLAVSDLTKSFPTPAEPLVVLNRVSLEMNLGQSLAVVGPSGSGKSSFLHVVGTLDTPTSGNVRLLGTDPFSLTEKELALFRNQHIGFVFQEHHLLPQLSAIENVLIPAVANGTASEESKSRAMLLLEQVGLKDRVTHRPAELSGGEKQRVAVARALLHQPKLLLADEPTGSLDRANAEQIGEMLLELQQKENIMLICVTHNEAFSKQFQKRICLTDGHFIEE